ncbi:MAG: hypothetical protein A3F10_05790 [Coxiella sp. RIFCSPHIGHO2_12_FULL_42_15]|nr:MAG: hypothetical protein A3F10_05790 [Coxiella sp. RIFCSPHIGHO2_12_FULL_42_15]
MLQLGIMRKKLSQTNPYLIDPIRRRALIARSVISSCAVEGIHVDLKSNFIEIPRRKLKKLYKSRSDG